jgi:hypothetical protein
VVRETAGGKVLLNRGAVTNNALRSLLAARSLDSEISVLAREPSGVLAIRVVAPGHEVERWRGAVLAWLPTQSTIDSIMTYLCDCDVGAGIEVAVALLENLNERTSGEPELARALAVVRRLCAGERVAEVELQAALAECKRVVAQCQAKDPCGDAPYFYRAESVRELVEGCLLVDDRKQVALFVTAGVEDAMQAAANFDLGDFDDTDHPSSGLFAVLLRAVERLFLARTSGAAERS